MYIYIILTVLSLLGVASNTGGFTMLSYQEVLPGHGRKSKSFGSLEVSGIQATRFCPRHAHAYTLWQSNIAI